MNLTPSARTLNHVSAAHIIEVGVVEDDPACRGLLTHAIMACDDMRLVWQAATLAEARRYLARSIDVLLVDIGLPDGTGLELIADIKAHQPECLVMVSTMFGDDNNLLSAISAGALGYLLKDVSATEVVEEIRSLHAGGSPINPMMARKLLSQKPAPIVAAKCADDARGQNEEDSVEMGRRALGLSHRETEVLQLVARGFILDEVASRIGITRHTARSYVRRIYQKLEVGSRAEAVRVAADSGLLTER